MRLGGGGDLPGSAPTLQGTHNSRVPGAWARRWLARVPDSHSLKPQGLFPSRASVYRLDYLLCHMAACLYTSDSAQTVMLHRRRHQSVGVTVSRGDHLGGRRDVKASMGKSVASQALDIDGSIVAHGLEALTSPHLTSTSQSTPTPTSMFTFMFMLVVGDILSCSCMLQPEQVCSHGLRDGPHCSILNNCFCSPGKSPAGEWPRGLVCVSRPRTSRSALPPSGLVLLNLPAS